MIKTVRALALLGASLALLPSPARAAGGAPMTPPGGSAPMESAPQKTPAEEAIDHYNAGIKLRDKGLAFQKQAEQAAEEKERAKLEKKAQKEFQRAITEYQMAAQKNPAFYQASSDLGFVLRKTGQYEVALESYNRALSLAPNYAPAIEYRGEAYLGLNRVEDAKQAYLQLFSSDRAKSDQLFQAMKGWVEKRRSDPGSLSPDAIQEFAQWLQQREEIAGQTSSLSELQRRDW